MSGRALEFRTRQTALCDRQIVVDRGGSVRIVVAGRDPSVANWLDSSGRRESEIVALANGQAAERPTIERVPLAALRERLPADATIVSQEARQEVLAKRRDAFLHI